MLRLSLAARLSVLVVAALLTVWLIVLGLYYLGFEGGVDGAFPSARKVATIIRLVEETPPDRRPLLLEGLSSDTLEVSLAAPGALAVRPEGRREVAAELAKRYEPAFGGRDAVFVAVPRGLIQESFPRLFGTAVNGLQFRIALGTGDTLVIDTRNTTVRSRLGLPVGFGAGFIGTMLALLALIVMQREIRPLRRLAMAADQIDLSSDPVLISPPRRSTPEIRSLVDAFNRLQLRLSQLLKARMALLGGISHDVRTVATRLRLRLDRLADGPDRQRAIQDIADMTRLLDDALLASRAGAGELQEELVELDELVAMEVEDRREAGALANLVVFPEARGVTVLGDRVALRRVVFNLVGNALTYGHVAHVVLDAGPGEAKLTVDDEGDGVPETIRAIVTEPFVRLESSRSRETGGAGLGLTIVRNLVEAHGGELSVGDAPGGGARFTVRLPLFDAAAGR
ncbi:HAMP domain-containing sensor histidine kinase [Aurantimonas sp. 22II-16-19i]|uniref:sensor histidine kinase n=1 Tax=Aurantimonas sp. 22II-16-19i TaxID=1317114 RepID=UPI0009F7DF6F|nr:HAMP domain-containing sensor histidine kinase [Aurantimonas sp. 22II-16-19i]ORE98149.1 integral membrane sensor signal transduction histidine kinase [Aurantimonas sp. 22II-16-19i]